jgi:general secretion pathway protein I
MSRRTTIRGGGARAQAGYTLIEIIVAFAILALGLTLLLGTLSGATRQVRQAGDAGRAGLHAQSLLAEFGELPEPGTRGGELEDGRYRWRLEVEPWTDPAPRGGRVRIDPAAARLLRLRLQVEWGEGGPAQRVQLSSLRLASPRPEGAAGP